MVLQILPEELTAASLVVDTGDEVVTSGVVA
jgi:hypothetical protein